MVLDEVLINKLGPIDRPAANVIFGGEVTASANSLLSSTKGKKFLDGGGDNIGKELYHD